MIFQIRSQRPPQGFQEAPAIFRHLQAGGPALCLAAPAYLVALYVMLCWTVSCRAASTSWH